MSEEKEQSKTKNHILWKTVGYSFLGLAAYGTVELIGKGVNKVGELRDNAARPDRTEFFKDEEGNRLARYDIDLRNQLEASITSYESWQSGLGKQLQGLISINQPKEVINLTDRIGKNFVIEGANLLQTAWLLGHTEDRVAVLPDREILWINNFEFNLKDRYDTQLASAWIQTRASQLKLRLKINQSQEDQSTDRENPERQISEFQDDLNLLFWLKERKAPIKFSNDAFAFFPRTEMVNVARIMYVVDRFKIPVPPEIYWCSGTCLDHHGPKVIGVTQVGFPDFLDKIILENLTLSKDLAHEIGHFISYVDGGRLLKMFKSVIGDSLPQGTRYEYVSEYAMTKFEEDFADTFMYYIALGEDFRLWLDELKTKKPSEWLVLQRKYDFMKGSIFNGVEFSYIGKVVIPDVYDLEQEFSGIHWSAENGTLSFSPNPNSLPGRRLDNKNFPFLILEIDKVIDIEVGFHSFWEKNAYKININRADLVNELSLFPLPGNDRVSIEVAGVTYDGVNVLNYPEKHQQFKPNLENGIQQVGRIAIPDEVLSLELIVISYSAVEVGQKRFIRDNNYKWSQKPVALRFDPEYKDGDPARLLLSDGTQASIISGPVEVLDTFQGETSKVKIWNVTVPVNQGNGVYVDVEGWVSERWIGEEVKVGKINLVG